MRDFQEYTRNPRSARRSRLLGLSLAAATVLVGISLWAGIVPLAPESIGIGGAGRDRSLDAVETASRGPREGYNLVSGGPMNVLVVGLDRRKGDDIEELGTRTDTIMLVRVDPGTGEIKLVSVPRDLLVEIAPNEMDRINAAYAYGGIERTIAVLQNYADVPIDHYAIVSFSGFRSVVDAMGGLEIDVQGEFPPVRELDEGIQTLDGGHALFYARYRGTPGGDLDRIERQQQVVAALRSQALEWESVTELPEIIKIADQKVRTDMGVEETVALGRVLMQRGRGARMTATQLEGTPQTLPNGDQVLVPDEAANEEILQEFR